MELVDLQYVMLRAQYGARRVSLILGTSLPAGFRFVYYPSHIDAIRDECR
jgi:hypothetical protein